MKTWILVLIVSGSPSGIPNRSGKSVATVNYGTDLEACEAAAKGFRDTSPGDIYSYHQAMCLPGPDLAKTGEKNATKSTRK